MNIRRWRRAAAVTAAVLALGIALPASANAAPTTTVDKNATGSLTVYKFDGVDSGLANDGSKVTGIDTSVNKPLAGAKFTVARVGGAGAKAIDLSTNAGWNAVQELATAVNTANPTQEQIEDEGYSVVKVNELEATIGSDASSPLYAAAKFTPLPVGLYYVYESQTPAGFQSVAPFLVTIPMTNPTDPSAWMYDVFVYPKNATGGSKTPVDTGNPNVGDTMSWKIDAIVPTVTSPKTVDAFAIRDALDPKLDYTSTTVTAKNASNVDVPLTFPGDYTVLTYPGGATPATGPGSGGQTIEVNFTAAGLIKLNTMLGGTVTAVINTKVNTAGSIENTALIFNNDDSYQAGIADVTTPPVLTKSAALEIHKIDKATPTKNLPGAKFELYWDSKTPFDGTSAKQVLDASSNVVEATTGVDGKVLFGNSMPLRYSDFAGGVQVAAGQPGYIYYYLVETQAPNEYELLAEPFAFEIKAADVSTGGIITVQIADVKTGGGFTLPFTGGVGTILFLLGGVVVLGGVGIKVASYSRRNRKTAAL